MRALEPLLLLMAGKMEEARTALGDLKKDATLSQQESALLASTATLLDENEETKAK